MTLDISQIYTTAALIKILLMYQTSKLCQCHRNLKHITLVQEKLNVLTKYTYLHHFSFSKDDIISDKTLFYCILESCQILANTFIPSFKFQEYCKG